MAMGRWIWFLPIPTITITSSQYSCTRRGGRRNEVPSNGATVVAFADLDGDGRPELIVGNSYNNDTRHLNSYIYWGSDGEFSPLRRTELPTIGVSGICIADFNGDGRQDILFANNGDGVADTHRSFIYWGSADGFEPGRSSELESHNAAGCAVADFNRDGFPDVAIVNGDPPRYVWVKADCGAYGICLLGLAKWPPGG